MAFRVARNKYLIQIHTVDGEARLTIESGKTNPTLTDVAAELRKVANTCDEWARDREAK